MEINVTVSGNTKAVFPDLASIILNLYVAYV